MQITDVKVFPVREEKLRAFVSVVLDDCFMINDIKIIQGRDSLFISMPSRRKKNGEFKDVAHPLNNETRRWIEERVLTEFRRAIEGTAAVPGSAIDSPTRVTHQTPHENNVPVPVVPTPSLQEVEELHLSDSFWSV